MAHAFRKYLNKRGSALFMVLSLMTALMILVMAMYFSVVSSREVQYKVFYQEQAYRSSVSIADAIYAGLEGDWKAKSESGSFDSVNFYKTYMEGLAVGECVTTGGNDFAAFGGTKEEQDQLGAYSVTITRMEDSKDSTGQDVCVYDLAVTASSGGVMDTTHLYINIVVASDEVEDGDPQIFATTGYVPNDVYYEGSTVHSTLFFDDEFASITAGSKIYNDLTACGSIAFYNNTDGVTPEKPVTWIVGNNFMNYGSTLNFSGGTLLVGGDATLSGGNLGNVDMYVLGDLYIRNSPNFNSCRVFVQGDIIFMDGTSTNKLPSKTYASSVIDNNGNVTAATAWSGVGDAKSVDDVKDDIVDGTATIPYYKWVVEESTTAGDDGIKYDSVKVEFTNSTYYLDWKGKSASNYYGKGETLNYTAYSIEDIVISESFTGEGNVNIALVIDTGDDPNNQVFIKANANRYSFDDEGNPVKNVFEWAPDGGYSTYYVIVRGCGSLVINVPDGVIYQASDKTAVMHESWYAVLGGTITTKAGYNAYTTENQSICFWDKAKPYIHTSCDEGCSDCNYVVKTVGTGKCSECGGYLTEISCERHNVKDSFCPVCEPDEEPNKSSSGKYYGLCKDHIDRKAVETRMNAIKSSSPYTYAQLVEGGDGSGNWHYPNNNIFIVSCDESADIRLATDTSGVTINQASFWGYVYAPYMAYRGQGDGAGWIVLCGGMIVSQFNIKGHSLYVPCYPDMLPFDLMDQQSRATQLSGSTSKSWKKSIAGY